MVDDGDHRPVDFHNSNYDKGQWEILQAQTFPSRGRSPTMGADIIIISLPRLTVEFPKSWKRMNEQTNDTTTVQTAYTSFILLVLVKLL